MGLDELVGTKPHALKAGPFGSALKKSFYVPSGYKVYGQEQVLRGDAYYGDYYIDGDRYEALKSCAVAPRDVLISLVGTVGMALVLPADAEPGIINPRLAKVTLDEELMLPEFLCVALQAPCIRHQIALTAHGGTMDVLNLSSLKKLSLPLPPVAAQRSIIGDVERIDSILQTLFRTVHDVRTRAKALRQRILQEAFAGRLVEQDPRDEPASLLLKRIRSERYSP